jgi:hypothetical protein
MGSTLLSTRFFVLFADLRFHARVLLPWLKCSPDPRCPIAPRLAAHAASLPAHAVAAAWEDLCLTRLLADFRAAHPRAVLFNTSAAPRPPPTRHHSHPTRSPPPALPRLGTGPPPAGPLVACLPLYGPNNQVVMLLHCAWLAARLAARLLLPPVRPHYLATGRANVSQRTGALAADGLFSAHFIYRHGLIVDADSDWGGLLPSLDVVVADPLHVPPCAAAAQPACTVASLMQSEYLRTFLASVGAHRAAAAAVRVVLCLPRSARAESGPEACARASLARGRVPLLLWNTIPLLRTDPARFPPIRAGPFRVPRAALARGLHQPRACLAIHIRLKDRDRAVGNGSAAVAGVPEARLLGAPAASVLMRNGWGELTLGGVIAAAERAAARRGLGLYVLMPYHRPVFEALGRRGVATVQDHDVSGLSELAVTHVDMALAAGCEAFVRDEVSTLSDVVASMMGGVGVLTPADVLLEDSDATAGPTGMRQ